MYISNYINGQNVQATEMNDEYASLEHTTNFFNNIIPCVYYGNTAVISGLNVTVLAGEGRAKDVIMSWLNYTNPLMIEYNVIETVLSIPANVTDGNGFIVVNSNINSLSSGQFLYTTTDTIQFVTSLTPSFPSGTLVGQVPLYSVTSTSTLASIINICTRLSLYMPDINDDTTSHTINVTGAGGLLVTNSSIRTTNGNITANGAGNIATTGSGNIAVNGSGQIYTTNGNITANGAGSIVTTGSGNIAVTGSGQIYTTNGDITANGGSIRSNHLMQAQNDINSIAGNIYTGNGASDGAVLWHDGAISGVTYYGNHKVGRPVFPGAGTGNNNAAVLGDITASIISGFISGGNYQATIQRTKTGGSFVTTLSGFVNTTGVFVTTIPLPIGLAASTSYGVANSVAGGGANAGCYISAATTTLTVSLMNTGNVLTGFGITFLEVS